VATDPTQPLSMARGNLSKYATLFGAYPT